jgi:hypothetical protein
VSLPGLSLLAGVGTLEPVPPAVSGALERVEIVTAIGERGVFRLTFRLGPGSRLPARFLLESGDLVRIVLITTVGADLSVAMDGIMVEHTVSTRGEGPTPALVIAGEDLTLLMDLVEVDGRAFSGMPVAARVQTILAAYSPLGVIPLVVPPPLTDVPNPAERVFHQHGTDFAYVRSQAARVGYRFTLEPGPSPGTSVAYWGPEPRRDRPRSPLVIDFGQPADVETLRLRFDTVQRVNPEALILDPTSRTVIPIPVPDIGALEPPLGAVVPPAQRVRRLHWTAKLTPLQAASALLAEAARSAEAMTGLGMLDVGRRGRRLRAGGIVEVRAASAPFDGLFAVSRVRDTITAQSHRQEFELVRAGLGATATKGTP